MSESQRECARKVQNAASLAFLFQKCLWLVVILIRLMLIEFDAKDDSKLFDESDKNLKSKLQVVASQFTVTTVVILFVGLSVISRQTTHARFFFNMFILLSDVPLSKVFSPVQEAIRSAFFFGCTLPLIVAGSESILWSAVGFSALSILQLSEAARESQITVL
jgi:hypothetical protein